MKTIILVLSIAVLTSYSCFSQQAFEPGTKIKQAFDTLTQGFRYAVDEDKTGTVEQFGITELYGALLSSGEKAAFTKKFSAFTTYVFVAGGDENCESVNIAIRDSKGNVVEKDKKSDRYSFVLFNPKSGDDYTVELHGSSIYNKGFAVIAVLERNISSDNQEMLKTFENFNKGWLEYNKNKNYTAKFPETNELLNFIFGDSYQPFIFWGNYVYDNVNFKWTNVKIFPLKNYAFVTAGDLDNTKDLNVGLKYNTGEDFETFGTDKHNKTIILFSPKRATAFDYEISGIRSKYGKTFIINCLLEIEK